MSKKPVVICRKSRSEQSAMFRIEAIVLVYLSIRNAYTMYSKTI